MTKPKDNVINLPSGRFIPEPEDIKDWDHLWRIPGRDHRGHKEPIQFTLPPQLFDAGVKICKSGLFPAQDVASFARSAWKLLVDLCYKVRPEMDNSTYRQSLAITDILIEEEINEEFSLVFTRMRGLVDRWVSRGDVDQARRVLLRIIESIRQMPMGYHRNQYLHEMQRQYADLLVPYGIDWDKERTAPVGLGDFLKGCEVGEDGV